MKNKWIGDALKNLKCLEIYENSKIKPAKKFKHDKSRFQIHAVYRNMFYIFFIDECKICMEDGEIAETVCVPCGHLIACVKCASSLIGNTCN